MQTFGVPGQPASCFGADLLFHQRDSLALERLGELTIRDMGILAEEDRHDLDGQGVAAQPVDDLERGLPLVVLGRVGDRAEAVQQGHRVIGLQRVQRQAADARQVVGRDPRRDQHVDVIALGQGPLAGLRRQQGRGRRRCR